MYLKNLFLAFAQLLTKTIHIFLLNVDRLGNALCAGDYRATISARVGYFSRHRSNRYWELLEWAINQAFYPLDGPNHCYQALQWENRKKYRRGNDIALAALSIIVLVACLLIAPVIYLIAKWKRSNA